MFFFHLYLGPLDGIQNPSPHFFNDFRGRAGAVVEVFEIQHDPVDVSTGAALGKRVAAQRTDV